MPENKQYYVCARKRAIKCTDRVPNATVYSQGDLGHAPRRGMRSAKNPMLYLHLNVPIDSKE